MDDLATLRTERLCRRGVVLAALAYLLLGVATALTHLWAL